MKTGGPSSGSVTASPRRRGPHGAAARPQAHPGARPLHESSLARAASTLLRREAAALHHGGQSAAGFFVRIGHSSFEDISAQDFPTNDGGKSGTTSPPSPASVRTCACIGVLWQGRALVQPKLPTRGWTVTPSRGVACAGWSPTSVRRRAIEGVHGLPGTRIVKLEDVQVDTHFHGDQPSGSVKVLRVKMAGADAADVTYKLLNGQIGRKTIFRADESKLSVASLTEELVVRHSPGELQARGGGDAGSSWPTSSTPMMAVHT